jgi:hypothetical protein
VFNSHEVYSIGAFFTPVFVTATAGAVPKKEFKLSMGRLKWFDRFLTNDIEAQIRFLSRRRRKTGFYRR